MVVVVVMVRRFGVCAVGDLFYSGLVAAAEPAPLPPLPPLPAGAPFSAQAKCCCPYLDAHPHSFHWFQCADSHDADPSHPHERK